jgi:hypothetical protein
LYLQKGVIGLLWAPEIIPTYWVLEDPPGKGINHCVPEGLYDLVPHHGTKYKDHWALQNKELGVYHQDDPTVQGERSAILIHNGNYVTDTEGCLLIGNSVKPAEPMVYGSVVSLTAFHDIMRLNPQLRKLQIQRG